MPLGYKGNHVLNNFIGTQSINYTVNDRHTATQWQTFA